MKKRKIQYEKPRSARFWEFLERGPSLGPVFVGFLLAFCGFETYFIVFQSSYFAMEEIQVKGNLKLRPKEVVEISEIERGARIFQLDFEQIQARLKADPRIKSSRIVQISPRKLQIQIEEEKALYYFWSGSTLIGYSGEGRFFAAARPEEDVKIRLELEEKEWAEYKLSLEKQVMLKNWVQALGRSKIQDYDYISLENLSEVYLKVHGTRVLLGEVDKFELHQEKLLAFLSWCKEEGKVPEYIDIRFGDMVVKLV